MWPVVLGRRNGRQEKFTLANGRETGVTVAESGAGPTEANMSANGSQDSTTVREPLLGPLAKYIRGSGTGAQNMEREDLPGPTARFTKASIEMVGRKVLAFASGLMARSIVGGGRTTFGTDEGFMPAATEHCSIPVFGEMTNPQVVYNHFLRFRANPLGKAVEYGTR